MSEIRAPAMVLVMFGTVMLGAVFVPKIQEVALWAVGLMYMSYALGRGVSLILDGVPHIYILAALAIELIIGLLCFYALWTKRIVG